MSEYVRPCAACLLPLSGGAHTCCDAPPTVPASEHRRLQAAAAAMRAALVRTKEFAAYVLDTESHWHECEQRPDDPLDPPNENCNCQVGIIAGIEAALSSSAGKGWVSPEEHAKALALPAGLFDALASTTAALEAAGLRSDLTKIARAVMCAEPEVLRAFREGQTALLAERDELRKERQKWMDAHGSAHRETCDLYGELERARAESADLRARLERAEALVKASISILPDSCHTPAEVEHRNRVADTLEHLGWLSPESAAALRSRLETAEKEKADAVRMTQLSIDCEKEERQARKDAEAIVFVHGLDCERLRERKASAFEAGRTAYDERRAAEVRRAVEEAAQVAEEKGCPGVARAIRSRSRGGA